MSGQTFIIRPEGDPSREPVLANVRRALELLPKNRAIAVTFVRHSERRSLDQNAALWAVAYATIGKTLGYDRDDLEKLHEQLLCEHFGEKESNLMGIMVKVPHQRSSKLSKIEFAGFYDYVQRRAAEFGVFVPDPDPLWKENRQQEAA